MARLTIDPERVRELMSAWPDEHRRQIAEAGARAVDQAILDAFTYLRPELRAAGFLGKDPIQWWVEYEELT